MKRTLLFFMNLAAFPAFLSAQAVWVASTGVDSATCGARTSPCATFQRGYNNAAIGGLVKAADAGDFGPVSISHTIALDGSGLAQISDPILISAGSSDVVSIRNILLFGLGTYGIGIFGSAQVNLSDVTIFGANTFGIFAQASDGTGTLTLEHVRVFASGGQNGLYNNGFSATIRDSVFAYAQNGIQTLPHGPSQPATTMIERCHIASNSVNGILATGNGGTAIVRVSNSVISDNATGVAQTTTGQVISFRTNMFSNNGTDGTPALSTSLK